MPSARRFTLLRQTVRNHPVVVASSAASVGVLLGAFVAVQLLAMPQPRADSAPVPPATLASKGEAKPVPETTGSAPTSDRTASVNCDQETWPRLSRPCVEELRSRHRTRAISVEKLGKPTISAIEASPPGPVAISPPVDLVSAPSAVFAAPETPLATLASAAPPQPAANIEAKKDKRAATKSKRKPKAGPKAPANQETSVASYDSDDRVTAIRRSGGGLIESLFGN